MAVIIKILSSFQHLHLQIDLCEGICIACHTLFKDHMNTSQWSDIGPPGPLVSFCTDKNAWKSTVSQRIWQNPLYPNRRETDCFYWTRANSEPIRIVVSFPKISQLCIKELLHCLYNHIPFSYWFQLTPFVSLGENWTFLWNLRNPY